MFWIWFALGLVLIGLAAHLYDRKHRRQLRARGLDRSVDGALGAPNTMLILDTQQTQHDRVRFSKPDDDPSDD